MRRTSLKINGVKRTYEQIAFSIDRCDLVSWLSLQKEYPKVYWRDRDTLVEHAAVGSLLSFAEPPVFDENPPYPVRFYGGMRFPSAKRTPLWEAFPCAFWLPAFEIIQSEKSAELLFHHIDERSQLPDAPFHLSKKENALSFDAWQKCIEHLLLKIHAGKIEKVVLAQKKHFSFSRPLCPWSLLSELRRQSRGATVFAFARSPRTAFLGASPERFFYRKDRRVSIDAVAATRRRGRSAEEDLFLERELHAHPKEKQEFAYVKDYIHKILLAFSEQCVWNCEDTVLKTTHIQHLYNRASALLKHDVTDRALIGALHPTPAVGGFPKSKALELIEELEPFERGWYASPVGWISAEESNLVVAIRSGLILGKSLHLFAGAGIVAESSAEKEWEEINDKMKVFLNGCRISQ